MDKKRFTPPRQLLSQDQYKQLTFAARKLYASVWNQLSWLGKDAVSRKDYDLAARAKITIEDIEQSRVDLHRAGLLEVRCINSSQPNGWWWEYRLAQP